MSNAQLFMSPLTSPMARNHVKKQQHQRSNSDGAGGHINGSTPSFRRRSDALAFAPAEKSKYQQEVLAATLEVAVEQLEDRERSLQLAAQLGQALTEREEQLMAELEEKNELLDQQFQELSQVKSELHESNEQLARTQRNLVKLNAMYDELNERASQHQQALGENASEQERLGEELQETQDLLQYWKKRCGEAESNGNSTYSERQQLEEEVSSLQLQLSHAHLRIDELHRSLQQLGDEQQQQLQTVMSEAGQQLIALRDQNLSLIAERDAVSNELMRTQAELKHLQNNQYLETADLQQLTSNQTLIDELKQSVNQAEIALQQKSELIEELQLQLETYRQIETAGKNQELQQRQQQQLLEQQRKEQNLMQMAHAFDNQLHSNRHLSSVSSSDNNSSTNSQLLPQKMVMISRTPTNSSASSDQETISKSSLTQTPRASNVTFRSPQPTPSHQNYANHPTSSNDLRRQALSSSQQRRPMTARSSSSSLSSSSASSSTAAALMLSPRTAKGVQMLMSPSASSSSSLSNVFAAKNPAFSQTLPANFSPSTSQSFKSAYVSPFPASSASSSSFNSSDSHHKSGSVLAELEDEIRTQIQDSGDAMKEFFHLTAMSVKMWLMREHEAARQRRIQFLSTSSSSSGLKTSNSSLNDQLDAALLAGMDISTDELYDEVKTLMLPFHRWHDWLIERISGRPVSMWMEQRSTASSSASSSSSSSTKSKNESLLSPSSSRTSTERPSQHQPHPLRIQPVAADPDSDQLHDASLLLSSFKPSVRSPIMVTPAHERRYQSGSLFSALANEFKSFASSSSSNEQTPILSQKLLNEMRSTSQDTLQEMKQGLQSLSNQFDSAFDEMSVNAVKLTSEMAESDESNQQQRQQQQQQQLQGKFKRSPRILMPSTSTAESSSSSISSSSPTSLSSVKSWFSSLGGASTPKSSLASSASSQHLKQARSPSVLTPSTSQLQSISSPHTVPSSTSSSSPTSSSSQNANNNNNDSTLLNAFESTANQFFSGLFGSAKKQPPQQHKQSFSSSSTFSFLS